MAAGNESYVSMESKNYGYCKFGTSCRNSRSSFAIRPLCKFKRQGRCSRGEGCIYRHGPPLMEKAQQRIDPIRSIVSTIVSGRIQGPAEEWFAELERRDFLFLLGDGNFEFTESLRKLGCRPAIP